ncbi:MAG: radical SAM family heme chaperone HemW [Clostridia bacterium]|nr:radical SAM family heme chaperone HemW [Clostridia bacterium]
MTRADIPTRNFSEGSERLGIYIHIPFCKKKCGYCDFCSFPVDSINLRENNAIESYIAKLFGQIKALSEICKNKVVDTIYFGGGTPTILKNDMLERVLDTVLGAYNVVSEAEITVECNPGTVDSGYLLRLRKSGFNRLSIGAQSLNDNELKRLGRIHTSEEFIATFGYARKAGFENISADLMFGIPGQTDESFAYSIEKMCSLSPEHISAYGLIIEDGTPFADQAKDPIKFGLPTEDTSARMYGNLVGLLAKNGYAQYEISNFSKPGYESKHNLRYWHGGEYLGVGLSAHSYLFNRRFGATRDLNKYLSCNFENFCRDGIDGYLKSPIFDPNDIEYIDDHDKAAECIMLGMRLDEGICFENFRKKYGIDFFDFIDCDKKTLDDYISRGYLEIKDGRIRFTTEGFYVSNYILADMLTFDV